MRLQKLIWKWMILIEERCNIWVDLQCGPKRCPFLYRYTRIRGFSPQSSPPHSFVDSSGLRVGLPFAPTKSVITWARPIELHNRWAKPMSCTSNLSFILTAFPSFALAGVVMSGSDDRNDTYFVHKEGVKRLRMRMIWSCRSISIDKSSVGTSGCSDGQFGSPEALAALPFSTVAPLLLAV